MFACFIGRVSDNVSNLVGAETNGTRRWNKAVAVRDIRSQLQRRVLEFQVSSKLHLSRVGSPPITSLFVLIHFGCCRIFCTTPSLCRYRLTILFPLDQVLGSDRLKKCIEKNANMRLGGCLVFHAAHRISLPLLWFGSRFRFVAFLPFAWLPFQHLRA